MSLEETEKPENGYEDLDEPTIDDGPVLEDDETN